MTSTDPRRAAPVPPRAPAPPAGAGEPGPPAPPCGPGSPSTPAAVSKRGAAAGPDASGSRPREGSRDPLATKRKRRPKDIGTDAERAVVRYLQANGWPGAERRALRGTSDAGDITGTPGVAWEVKARNRPVSDGQVDAWLAETETERTNARAEIGVLVLRRPRFGDANARSWWAVMYANAWILGASTHTIPVRMLLADACWLLRRAGYGDPLEDS